MRIAVYPGSFDPPTLGHLDVVERAERLFDKVIVAVGRNSAKNPLLGIEERVEAIKLATAHIDVEVDTFSGLLVDYVSKVGASAIVRGLRANADFEYEFQMALVNRRLKPELESVFLMTKWEYSYLSSSIVREVALLGGDFSEMVPRAIIPLLQKALSGKSGG